MLKEQREIMAFSPGGAGTQRNLRAALYSPSPLWTLCLAAVNSDSSPFPSLNPHPVFRAKPVKKDVSDGSWLGKGRFLSKLKRENYTEATIILSVEISSCFVWWCYFWKTSVEIRSEQRFSSLRFYHVPGSGVESEATSVQEQWLALKKVLSLKEDKWRGSWPLSTVSGRIFKRSKTHLRNPSSRRFIRWACGSRPGPPGGSREPHRGQQGVSWLKL